jgi:lysophospholipase L1-like esterase
VADCVPNQNSLHRTLLAARLWRSGRAPLVVFTGGRPKDMPCAVSEVMAAFAVELGVPGDRIVTETVSRSTHENATLSAPLLRSRGVRRVRLVTDRLHMSRAAGVFAREGFAIERSGVPVYNGHPDNTSMLAGGLREYAALAYYRLRGFSVPAAIEADGAPARSPKTSGSAQAPAAAQTPMPHAFRNPSGPLVILGASYAAGWKPGAIDGRTVVNKGIAGQQSFELAARFEHDVVATQPRAVILWGFINDVFRSAREGREAALVKARSTFEEMVRAARAQGIEPIIATEATITSEQTWSAWAKDYVGWMLGKTSYQDGINAHVLQMNQWLRDYAAREQLLLLDLHTVLSDGRGRRRSAYAAPDGSHISDEGYRAITAYAAPLLAARLRQP